MGRLLRNLVARIHIEGAYHAMWKHMRFLTKFITFGVMYGRGAESLAKGELNCSLLQAQGYMNQFFDGYPKYKRWLDDQFRHAKEQGFVQNIFGFKRRWPFVTMDNIQIGRASCRERV